MVGAAVLLHVAPEVFVLPAHGDIGMGWTGSFGEGGLTLSLLKLTARCYRRQSACFPDQRIVVLFQHFRKVRLFCDQWGGYSS